MCLRISLAVVILSFLFRLICMFKFSSFYCIFHLISPASLCCVFFRSSSFCYFFRPLIRYFGVLKPVPFDLLFLIFCIFCKSLFILRFFKFLYFPYKIIWGMMFFQMRTLMFSHTSRFNASVVSFLPSFIVSLTSSLLFIKHDT